MPYPAGVSDIHLTPGVPPMFRTSGNLTPVPGFDRLTPADTDAAARHLLSPQLMERLEQAGTVDASRFIGADDVRARINAYRQRGSYAIAIRVNSMHLKSFRELGLPPIVEDFCRMPRGLILVTGTTGVGKTTTMVSMIDWMNHNLNRLIVTIEDPIEYMFRHDQCIINQRQVGSDAPTFAEALRNVLRQDPDVIVVGEMRDLESISTALTAAETGHLVISSLHTLGATKTIDRIIDVFPPNQQQQIRVQLSMVLQGIISQQLIPRIDQTGRVLTAEVMTATSAVRNLIRTDKTHQLQNVIITSSKLGMQSMDESIFNYYANGVISESNAMTYSTDPDYMQKLISAHKGWPTI